MAAWDFAGPLEGGFRLGFGVGEKRLAAERQKKMDADSAEERGFQRRKALGFESPESQAEAMFRDRMLKKEAEDNLTDAAKRRLMGAQAGYYEDRYPGGPAGRGETGVAAQLKAIGEGISSIDEEEPGAFRQFFGAKLPKEDQDLRESLRRRRNQLLKLEAGAAPAKKSWQKYDR